MRWAILLLAACGEGPECGPAFLECLAHCMDLADQETPLLHCDLPAGECGPPDAVDGLISFTCEPPACECGPGGAYADHWERP